MEVVRAIEEGAVGSITQARAKYGIGGATTVGRWVREYGKNHLIGKVIRVETADEKSELKKLKQRVKVLEKTLCDSTIDLAIERAYIDILAEKAGIEDLSAFKKKPTSSGSKDDEQPEKGLRNHSESTVSASEDESTELLHGAETV